MNADVDVTDRHNAWREAFRIPEGFLGPFRRGLIY